MECRCRWSFRPGAATGKIEGGAKKNLERGQSDKKGPWSTFLKIIFIPPPIFLICGDKCD